jgi:hypothetical protein
MTRVRFEPTIPAFEREKTVHALDRTATVIGACNLYQSKFTGVYVQVYTYIYYVCVMFMYVLSSSCRSSFTLFAQMVVLCPKIWSIKL